MADGFATPSLSGQEKGDEINPRRFSVAELDAMFDANILSRDERIELVNGEILQMNSQMMPHGVIKFNLAHKLAGLLGAEFRISTETTVQLADATLVDPDIFITFRKPLERRYFQGEELLLAVEVADTSLGYDLGQKANLYAQAGVPELWVIDVNNAQTWIHSAPSGADYASIITVAFDDALTLRLDESVKIIVGELLV